MKTNVIPAKLGVLAVILAVVFSISFMSTPAFATNNISSIDISGLPVIAAGEKAPADGTVTLKTGNANANAQYLGVWKASDLANVKGSEEPLPFEGTFVEGEKYVAMIYVETAPGYLFAKSSITGDPAMLQAVLKMIQVEPGSDIDKILSYFGAFTGSVKLPQGYVVNNAAGGGFDFAPLVFDVPGNKDGEMTDPEHSILIVQAETTAKAIGKVRMTEGEGSKYYKGSDKVLTFRADADISSFKEVRVDGTTIAKDKDYTVKSGSIIVELKPTYLNGLSSGSHEVQIFTESGGQMKVASANFTVQKKQDGGNGNNDPSQNGQGDDSGSDDSSQKGLNDSNKSPKTGIDNTSLAIALLSFLMGTILFGIQIVRNRKSSTN